MTKNTAKNNIKKALKNLPNNPGVYKMINKDGVVIYVGKAKNLNKRVRQYFRKNYQHSMRTKKLVENIFDLSYTVVDSELEASILENNQIKQLQPRYNVIMKDDKNYVYIKITNEDFPRIQIVRRLEKDGAKYIGPKSAKHKVATTLKVLKKVFTFRHCNLDIKSHSPKKTGISTVTVKNRTIKYPCIDYHIKRCMGPCIGEVSQEEYKKTINEIVNFLEGRSNGIIDDLKSQMTEYAKAKEFEKAAKLRDKILQIEEINQRQKVSDPNRKDTDIINYLITQNRAYFNLFQIRDGKLIGQENFIVTAQEIEDKAQDMEVLEGFMNQYYAITTDIPKEILIPHEIENPKGLIELINLESNKKPKILIPQKGDKNKLLEMSLKNAMIYADRAKPSWQEESELSIKATEDLQKILNIDTKLRRIECYDISHLSGTETVGSMIVFENGAPKKAMYRKFILKTVKNKADDYKSMHEVLFRRFSRITLDRQTQEYKVKKARIKDKTTIEKKLKNKIEIKNYYILEKKEKTFGFVEIIEHSKKTAEIKNLWIDTKNKNNRLSEKILKEVIKKSKSKRIYICIDKKEEELLLKIGFEEINKNPEEIKVSKKLKCIVYDKNKHKEDSSFSKIPDLVIIDGGKGQLKECTKVLKELDIEIKHISLAKRLEEIFSPDKKHSLILERNSQALKLLQRARDEAHRFAITFQRSRREF